MHEVVVYCVLSLVCLRQLLLRILRLAIAVMLMSSKSKHDSGRIKHPGLRLTVTLEHRSTSSRANCITPLTQDLKCLAADAV